MSNYEIDDRKGMSKSRSVSKYLNKVSHKVDCWRNK